eukprot:1140927-Pelagomonas_calceolata.AAC.1
MAVCSERKLGSEAVRLEDACSERKLGCKCKQRLRCAWKVLLSECKLRLCAWKASAVSASCGWAPTNEG